jgi:hypothetical protein
MHRRPVHGGDERQKKRISFQRYRVLVNDDDPADPIETPVNGFAENATANTRPLSRFRYDAHRVLSFLKLDPTL